MAGAWARGTAKLARLAATVAALVAVSTVRGGATPLVPARGAHSGGAASSGSETGSGFAFTSSREGLASALPAPDAPLQLAAQ